MKWTIIVLVMLSLLGSMMWVMPTKRQKYQAALRLAAKKAGFQIQLEQVTAPRATGEMEPETRNGISYRLLRHDLSRAEKNHFQRWQIFKVDALANTGLPSGWSWSQGENILGEEQLQALNELITALPEGIFSIESSAVYLGVIWDEEGGEEQLLALKQTMDDFLGLGI